VRCGRTGSRLSSRIITFKYIISVATTHRDYRYHGRRSIYHVRRGNSVIRLIVVTPARVCSVSLIPTVDRARDFKLFGRCARSRSRVQSVQSRPPDRLTRRGKKDKTKRVKCTYVYRAITLFYHYYRLPMLRQQREIYILYYIVSAMSGFVKPNIRDSERLCGVRVLHSEYNFFFVFFFYQVLKVH